MLKHPPPPTTPFFLMFFVLSPLNFLMCSLTLLSFLSHVFDEKTPGLKKEWLIHLANLPSLVYFLIFLRHTTSLFRGDFWGSITGHMTRVTGNHVGYCGMCPRTPQQGLQLSNFFFSLFPITGITGSLVYIGKWFWSSFSGSENCGSPDYPVGVCW